MQRGVGHFVYNPRANARRAIEIEDWIRAWPTPGQTAAIDRRCSELGRRFRKAPDWARREAFTALEFIRLKQEPTAAELVRVGILVEEALHRVDHRAAQFERIFRGG